MWIILTFKVFLKSVLCWCNEIWVEHALLNAKGLVPSLRHTRRQCVEGNWITGSVLLLRIWNPSTTCLPHFPHDKRWTTLLLEPSLDTGIECTPVYHKPKAAWPSPTHLVTLTVWKSRLTQLVSYYGLGILWRWLNKLFTDAKNRGQTDRLLKIGKR